MLNGFSMKTLSHQLSVRPLNSIVYGLAGRRRGLTLVFAFGLAAIVLMPTTHGAAASFEVDGATYNLPMLQTGDVASVKDFDISMPEFSLSFSSVLDADPSISYAFTVTDFGAPSSFSFTFSTPIVPTGPSVLVDSWISGSLTDATGNGVSMTPVSSLIMLSAVNGVSMGVDVGPSLAAGAGAPAAVYAYGPYSIGPQPGPDGIWTELTTTVNFQLSGNDDIATLSGGVQIVEASQVPESGPGWAGIVALSLVVFAGGAAQSRALAMAASSRLAPAQA
jgi:hypothetical protein